MIRQANLTPTATAYRKSASRRPEPAALVAAKQATVCAELSTAPAPLEVRGSLTGSLSDEERGELRANEETIVRGARAWLEMGRALTTIRDKRLYRETHKRFEAYCWEKFRLEHSAIYQFMAAFRRYQLVLPIAAKLCIEFTAESQVRPLCKCQGVDLPAVLKLAAKNIEPNDEGNRIPTAKIIDEAVKQVKRGGGSLDSPADGHAMPANGHGPQKRAAENGEGTRAMQAPSDPAAAEVIRAMPEWSNSDLMTVARAMARELQTRGLIKNFNVA